MNIQGVFTAAGQNLKRWLQCKEAKRVRDEAEEAAIPFLLILEIKFESQSHYDIRLFQHAAIINDLPDEHVDQFIAVVSEELRTTHKEKTITFILSILPPILWPKIHEIPRLRTEDRLTDEIKRGTAKVGKDLTTAPLGTWAGGFLQYFTNRGLVAATIIGKLRANDMEHRRYIAKFFMPYLSAIMSNFYDDLCVSAISLHIQTNDQEMTSALLQNIRDYPIEWQKSFAKTLENLTNPEKPRIVFEDGTPFLTALDEDELPF